MKQEFYKFWKPKFKNKLIKTFGGYYLEYYIVEVKQGQLSYNAKKINFIIWISIRLKLFSQ